MGHGLLNAPISYKNINEMHDFFIRKLASVRDGGMRGPPLRGTPPLFDGSRQIPPDSAAGYCGILRDLAGYGGIWRNIQISISLEIVFLIHQNNKSPEHSVFWAIVSINEKFFKALLIPAESQ